MYSIKLLQDLDRNDLKVIRDDMKPEENKNLLYTMFAVLVLKGDDQPSWEKVRAAFLDVNFLPEVAKVDPL